MRSQAAKRDVENLVLQKEQALKEANKLVRFFNPILLIFEENYKNEALWYE